MRWFALLFLMISPFLMGEELIVHVSSKETLKPLYILLFQEEQSGFSQNYSKQLEKVFQFDFANNGKTRVLVETAERKAILSQENDLLKHDSMKWQKIGAEYVVKIQLSKGKIAASVFSTLNKQLKTLDTLPITGELAKDRIVAHRISDAIFEALFKAKGIASSHILYTVRTRLGSDATKWLAEVWQADYDGANAKEVTHEKALCVTPTYLFSLSGRSQNFLYVSYKMGQPKIYAASTQEGVGKRMTYLRGNQLMPAISRKLDKIAFISDITGNPDLFVQDFSLEKGLMGKPVQVFSAPQATQGCPTFSPDGKKLGFVSNKEGTPRIYVIDIPKPGTSLKEIKPLLISKQNRDNTCPSWSPDGKKIAYSASVSGIRQIWIYDFETKKEMPLTEGSGHKENPTWGADSLHLIFNSSTEARSELYLINLNQKEAVKITDGPGEKRFPSWEPLFSSSKEERTL